jgi:hypothetical protein
MNWLNRLVMWRDCTIPALDSIGKAGFTVNETEHTVLPKAPIFVPPCRAGPGRDGRG